MKQKACGTEKILISIFTFNISGVEAEAALR